MTSRPGNEREAQLGSKVDRLADLTAGSLPILVAFVSVPLAIYLPNQSEFYWDPGVLWPFLVLVLVGLAGLCALWFLGTRARRAVVRGLIFVGLLLLISDVAAPLEWGGIDGMSLPAEPRHLTMIQLALAAGLTVGLFLTPYRVLRTIGGALAAAILLWNIGAAATGIERKPAVGRAPTAKQQGTVVPADPQGLPNVYQIVLDGFSSRILLEAIETLRLEDEFAGFTVFERNLANYQWTESSLASLLTGTFYGSQPGGVPTDSERDVRPETVQGHVSNPGPDRSRSLGEWHLEARAGGLGRKLQELGYSVAFYAPDEAHTWMYEGADEVYTSRELAGQLQRGADPLRLMQIVAVRLAPNPLRLETFGWTDSLFRRTLSRVNGIFYTGSYMAYEFYTRLSLPLAEVFLANEADRSDHGRYVFLHLMMTHPPFAWTSDCELGRSNYMRSANCAVRLMAQILRALERLGRLDDSLVIFHSDHGYHNHPAIEPAFAHPMPADVAGRVEEWTDYTDVVGFQRRAHALMMVKTPGADGPLRVSQAPTQLADIPASVYEILGVDGGDGVGRSLFSIEEHEDREIHHFFATQRSDAKVQHISYSWQSGWTAYLEIPRDLGASR